MATMFQQTPTQSRLLSDKKFGENLLLQAADASPTSGWGALARALTGGIGGYTSAQADKRLKEEDDASYRALAQALAVGQDWKNPDDPSQTLVKGSQDAMVQALMGNPRTAGIGAQFQLDRIGAQNKSAIELAAERAKYGMKAEFEPKIAGATEAAKNPALAERGRNEQQNKLDFEPKIEAAKNPVLADRAAMEANARLPSQEALARTNAGLDVEKAGPIAQAQAAAAAPGKVPDRENVLRDEYNNLTKDFRTVQDAYSKIKGAANNGAGDMSLLYSYVKLLDPGSVVRESEFATAAASGSLGERIQGLVQRVISGQRLPDSLRADFMREAENIYKAQKSGADRMRDIYTEMAKRGSLDPRNVIADYSAPAEMPQRPTMPVAPAVPGTRLRFDAQGNPIQGGP